MVNYTQFVERWLTESKQALIRNTNRLFSTEYLLNDNKNYNHYLQGCLYNLKKLRDQHGTLGYALIRQLHCDEAQRIKTEPNGMCQICDKFVHTPDILSQKTIHEDDLPTYASIFTCLAIKAGRFKVPDDITEKLLYKRFEAIFTENRFLKNTPTQETFDEIKKIHVVELCYSLGWDSQKCDNLLLRSDLDPLWPNTQEDSVFRWILDVKEAKWRDRYEIPAAVARQADLKKKPAIIHNPATSVAVNTLEKIITDEALTEKQRRKEYVNCLFEYQHVFDHFSNTSRNVFERLLLMGVRNMGWQSSLIEALPQNTLDCLDDDIPPLSGEQQERLIKALYTGQSPTTADLFSANEEDLCFKVSFKSDLYSYPIRSGEKFYRVSLHDELLALLSAEAPIGKNHILYALHLVHVTSQKYKCKESRENFLLEFHSFVETSNIILNDLHLPGFYAACPLEYAIALAYLGGAHRQDVFADVTATFESLTVKQEKPEKLVNAKTATAAEPANMPGAFTYSLKRDLDSSMIHFSEDVVEKLKQASGTDLIYDTLEKIAAKITENWKVIGLLPTNVEFTRESIIFCPDGYTPVSLGKPDKTLTDLLFGEDSPNGEKLKAFWVPFEGKELTLYDLAAKYREEGEVLLNTFLQNANLSLRYRQNCILRTIASLVMVNFKVKERPKIYTKKAKSPFIQFPFVNETDTLIKAEQTNVRQIESGETPGIKTFSKTLISENTAEESKDDTEEKMDATEEPMDNTDEPMDNTDEPMDDTEESMDDTVEVKEDDDDAEDNTIEDAEDTEEMAEGVNEAAEDDEEKVKDQVASGNEASILFKEEAESYPMLSDLEIQDLLLEYREKGDQKAKDKLCHSSLRILVYVASMVYYNGAKRVFEIQDLIHYGYFALDKAIDNYRISDDGKKATFSTYVSKLARWHMLDEVRKNSRGIKLPRKIEKEIRDFEKAKEKLSKELGRDPSLEEVALFLNKSETELKNIYRNKETSTVVSYHSPVSEDGEETFLNTIPDPSASVETRVIAASRKEELAAFPPRTAAILQLHLGLNDEEASLTLPEIASQLGITLEETVRRELDAIRRLEKNER